MSSLNFALHVHCIFFKKKKRRSEPVPERIVPSQENSFVGNRLNFSEVLASVVATP